MKTAASDTPADADAESGDEAQSQPDGQGFALPARRRSELLRAAKKRGAIIVTNNPGLPAELAPNVARQVYLLGGHVRLEMQVTIGAVGFPQAGPIKADTAILGVGGISVDGLSTTMLEEAAMMAAMIAAAR